MQGKQKTELTELGRIIQRIVHPSVWGRLRAAPSGSAGRLRRGPRYTFGVVKAVFGLIFVVFAPKDTTLPGKSPLEVVRASLEASPCGEVRATLFDG